MKLRHFNPKQEKKGLLYKVFVVVAIIQITLLISFGSYVVTRTILEDEAEFKAPDSFGEYKTVFESLNPMAECPFIVSLKGTKRLAAKDGWYEVDKGAFRLEFPKDIWKGTGKFRFSVDMETRQTKSRTYTLLLRNLKTSRNANARIYTPKGESGKMRYVIEFDKKNPTHHYCLLLREGDKGYVRFDRVRIERI